MKNRTNLFLTVSFFAVVTALVSSSFYLWYSQVPGVANAQVPAICPEVEDAARVPGGHLGVESAIPHENGVQFWTAVMVWAKNLWPKLVILADSTYCYLVKIAYQTKLNLLWRYRHKQTVIGIVCVVLVWFLLVFLALWISYTLGKRRGRRQAYADSQAQNKKR